MSQAPDSDGSDRYLRQSMFYGIGREGQTKLRQSRVLICGCGALGSVIANTLARAGIGFLRIVDRDFLELNNLQRQVLYDEDDVRSGLPKAIAAAEKLQRINHEIEVEPVVADVTSDNIKRHCADVDMILDGTDNFETRFLLNDAAVQWNLPWVFGGCLGSEGQTMTIVPGQTPCLTCLMPDGPPPVGSTPTCDSAGILSPIINVIASLQACEAIKILSGHPEDISRDLVVIDVWDNQMRRLNLASLNDKQNCATCNRHERPWLEGKRGSQSAVLCGRNAVQLRPPADEKIDLERLEQKLSSSGQVSRNKFLLKFSIGSHQLTVFPDGRAIVHGTEEIAVAKTLYSKWIGN